MSSKLIKLNVRGTSRTVEKSIIEQLDFFKNEMDRWTNNPTKLFINCDLKTFDHILNFLTVSNYIIPDKYAYNAQIFLDFYSPKKFTIKTISKNISQKSGLTNNVFVFDGHDAGKEKLLEHNGIRTFYFEIFGNNLCDDNKCLKFKLKLWDKYNSITITHLDKYYRLTSGINRYKIPRAIISI